MQIIVFWIQIAVKIVPKDPVDNKSSSAWVRMVWHCSGNTQFPEPMMSQYNDAYMRHLVTSN